MSHRVERTATLLRLRRRLQAFGRPSLVALLGWLAVPIGGQEPAKPRPAEWPVYGGSAASDRHSPLRQITTANVDRLEEAWRFDTGETVTLPFAANTTPATYEAGGRQYVVVAAGGGKSRDPSGGMFIAYRLGSE